MIVIDTSALVDALTGSRRSGPALRRLLERGERLNAPTLVLYEWFRGPRLAEELVAQEALLPRTQAITFGVEQAELAANIYAEVEQPRGREIDIAIAACALSCQARIWTLNTRDFADIPGVSLADPE